MLRTFALSAAVLSAASVPVFAEPPKVATDIAPVHSLVSLVMGTVAEPSMIVRQGASPHDYSLRPSEARAVQNADLIVWVGPEFTPWLEKPLTSLADGVATLELLGVPGTLQLGYRDLGDEDHDDHGGEGDHAEHGETTEHEEHEEHKVHDDHDEHAGHDDHAVHEDHADHADEGSEDDHAGHDHDGVDPHAWLDPRNAQVWLTAIAENLAELDPDNAETYRANAKAAIEGLKAQEAALLDQLKTMSGQSYVAFHDAYQYFENRFGLRIAGTVALGDASDPSPARVAALRDRIVEKGVVCALAEPQYDPRLLQAATETGDVKIGVIDPLGSTLDTGPDLYGQLLAAMAAEFAACTE